MKAIVDRAALLDAVNLVSGAVAARGPRPQLSCVKISASKDKDQPALVLAGTDAEIALRLALASADVQQPGEVVIPADKLKQIVQAEERDPTLTFEGEADACHIRGSDATFKVFGFPASDFPPIPDYASAAAQSSAKPRGTFTCPAGELAGMVAKTSFATARENSRYAINGVLLKRDAKRLELVATDGRRLALCRATVTGGDKDAKPVSAIVPTKALNMFLRLVRDPEEAVHVVVTDAQILFGFGERGAERATLSSNLVEGTFPPYEEVIPKDQDKRVTFDRDVLLSAVRRAALLTNEDSRGVRMKFNAADKTLELFSRSADQGEARVRADLRGYDGDDIEIGFNPAFIIDVLKVVEDPQVIIEMKASNKPGVMRSGADFVYVVMPVNLQ